MSAVGDVSCLACAKVWRHHHRGEKGTVCAIHNYGPACAPGLLAPGSAKPRPHIVDGRFQSDKYPTCPPGKVPLSTKDPTAQDLLWEYAQRRRSVDAEFSDDLEYALRADGYAPPVLPEWDGKSRARQFLLFGLNAEQRREAETRCQLFEVTQERDAAQRISQRQGEMREEEAAAYAAEIDRLRATERDLRTCIDVNARNYEGALSRTRSEKEEAAKVLEGAFKELLDETDRLRAALVNSDAGMQTLRAQHQTACEESIVLRRIVKNLRGVLLSVSDFVPEDDSRRAAITSWLNATKDVL